MNNNPLTKHNNRHGRSFSGPVLPVTFFLVLAGCLNSVSAYNWENSYGVDTGVGAHDNYRLTDDNEVDTTSIDFGGFARIEGTTEISGLGLTLKARNKAFSDSSVDDETSYNLGLNTYRTNERLGSSLNVGYDSASTTQTELEDTGVNEDGTRDTVSIAPGLNYQFDEKNSLSMDLNYKDVTYDKVSLTEHSNTSASLSWRYTIDETRSVSTSYVYSLYDPSDPDDPDAEGDTDTNSLNLGYKFQTSEATTYDITLGVTDVDGPQISTTSGTGAFNAHHQTDARNNFSLSLSKSYEGSGAGEVQEQERLSLQWNHGLSDRSHTFLSADGTNKDDRGYLSFQAGYNYNYTREVVLSASYRFRTRTEDDSFDVDSASSNTLFLKLSYSPL